MNIKEKEIKLKDVDIKAWNKQFQNWEFFLNNGIGVVAFGLALSCLGTASPSINAGICFFFLSIVYFTNLHKFPPILKFLRKKDELTELEAYLKEDLEKNQLGLRAVVSKYAIFVVGYGCLILVIAANLLSEKSAAISQYVYG